MQYEIPLVLFFFLLCSIFQVDYIYIKLNRINNELPLAGILTVYSCPLSKASLQQN